MKSTLVLLAVFLTLCITSGCDSSNFGELDISLEVEPVVDQVWITAYVKTSNTYNNNIILKLTAIYPDGNKLSDTETIWGGLIGGVVEPKLFVIKSDRRWDRVEYDINFLDKNEKVAHSFTGVALRN